MAAIDSLNIKVDASARSANEQLDKLVKKMMELRRTLGGLNANELNAFASGMSHFTKAAQALSGVKTSDFTKLAKGLDKLADARKLENTAQSVEQSVGSLQKALGSGLKFDSKGIQNMQKSVQSLANEFSSAGKGTALSGTLTELENEADTLKSKLEQLSEKEQKALAVGNASTESKIFRSLQYEISSSLNRLSELEQKIAEIKAKNVKDIAELPIVRSDAATSSHSSVSGTRDTVKNLLNAGSMPEGAKYSAVSSEKSLNETLAKVQSAESAVQGFAGKIAEAKAQLASLEMSGKSMGTDEWDRAYIALQKVVVEAKEYKNALNKRAVGMDTDIKSTDRLDIKLRKLKEDLKQLKEDGFGFGDKAFDDTYKEILKTDSALKKYKTDLKESVGDGQNLSTFGRLKQAFNSIWTESQKAGSPVSGFGSKLRSLMSTLRGNAVSAFGSRLKALIPIFHGTTSSTGNLISKLAKLYVGFRSLRGVGNYLRSAVESSMDYIEEYNYFDTTMGKIVAEWGKEYKKYGYQNAEEYGKSFKNRLTDTMSKMTGFQMKDDGNLADTGAKNLGLEATQMTNYAASIAQVTNSVGMTGEASTVTSEALSMLAGDMSSFKNLDMDTVMNNFSSGLIGQSRALYKYGIDTSNATLKQYALANGIEKSVSKMSQSEKMQLRMLAILDQSKVAWGDLAKTINSPSNQLRLLNNNFKSLSRTIGAMVLPTVAKVLPYINGLVIAIRRLFEWTASMLGIDLSKVIGSSGAGYSDAFEGLEDSADDAKDAVDDTSDSVKKLSKQLMGFDELNVINTNSSKKKDDDEDSTPIDLTSQLSSALADYKSVWDKAYKDMTSDAEKFADKLTNLFKAAWKSGDGTDIGSAIAGWLNKGISWVNNNVDQFAEGAKKIAKLLATTVNGFVSKLDWAGLGSAIGKSMKAAIEAETTFFETVDWVNLGKSIASSLNAWIDTGVIQSYLKSAATKLRSAIETAFGAITTFDFDGLGKALGQGINDAFAVMNKVNKKTGLNGWQELGQTISSGISGILTSFTTALDTVEWDDVGQAIADLIGSIDFGGVTWKLGKLTSSMATAFYKLVSNKSIWGDLGNKIGDGINQFFTSMGEVNKETGMNGWQTLGTTISDTFKGFAETMTTALETVKWEKVGQAIADFIGSIEFGTLTWDLIKLANAVVDAAGKSIKGIVNKAPLESAVVGLFVGLKLTGLDTKLSAAITTFLANKNLTLGKVAMGLALSAATIKFFNSDDVLTSALATPLAAFFAAKTFGVSTSLSLKITAAVAAVSVSWNAGKTLGEMIQDATSTEDMSQYRYNFKFSDLFTYTPSEWIKGIQDWWGDTWGSVDLKQMFKDLISGDFHLQIPFTGISLPSRNDCIKAVTTWWNSAKSWIGDKYVTLKAAVQEKVEGALDKVKGAWNAIKDKASTLTANAKEGVEGAIGKLKDGWNAVTNKAATLTAEAKEKAAGAIAALKSNWNAIKNSKAVKTLAQTGKDIIDNAKKSWDAIKSGKATKTLKEKGKSAIEKVSKIWNKIKDRDVTQTLKQKGADAFNKVKKAWDSLTDKKISVSLITDAVKSGIKLIIDWINKYIIGSINKIKVTIPKWVPKMGGKDFGFNLQNIAVPKFATGGFPEQGQYFLAREKGPELVGTIGNKTAVANNNQIVQSVSDGVFNALNPVLTQVCNAINSMGNGSSGQPLYVEGVSDGDIVRITTKANTDHKNRFGKPLYI
ncbi:MAG: hypothetical protein MR316_01470 [Lachnospiraceae bacterium]|nr:hypothetical protein [Lachnospiraceae bacterium]